MKKFSCLRAVIISIGLSLSFISLVFLEGSGYSVVDSIEFGQKIYIASIDPKKVRFMSVEKAPGDLCSREELSSMCLRHSPAIAFSCGIFRRGGRFNGIPYGLTIMESYLYTDSGFCRPVLSIDNETQSVSIELKKLVWSVKIGDQEIFADRVNQPAIGNEVVFFNSFFGNETKTSVNGIELVVEKGKLVQIRTFCGSAPVVAHGYVVRIGLQHPLAQVEWKKYLAQPCSTKILTSMLDLERDGFFAAQGIMMLVANGKVLGDWKQQFQLGGIPLRSADEYGIDLSKEEELDTLINKPNAHVAIGLTIDGIIKILACDGGVERGQIGLNIDQIAKKMLDFGCVSAMLSASGRDANLWFHDRLLLQVNPSDQILGVCEEAPISTAVLFFENKEN